MPEVVVKGTKIHYLEKKSRTSGPDMTVVLIHGSGGNAGLWRKVMEGLADGYDSLAVDLPGHGKSEGEGMKSIAEYREFVKDFFGVLGMEKIALGVIL